MLAIGLSMRLLNRDHGGMKGDYVGAVAHKRRHVVVGGGIW
jgi:cobalamin synthase